MGSGSIGATFVYILGWTIVWAFFATFLNYILGIVLALMINNKHIKFKKNASIWKI
jgi:arabinogalactan oligomer/maltooligosaccharide transport system permease protein